jgi:hypothetical protein
MPSWAKNEQTMIAAKCPAFAAGGCLLFDRGLGNRRRSLDHYPMV